MKDVILKINNNCKEINENTCSQFITKDNCKEMCDKINDDTCSKYFKSENYIGNYKLIKIIDPDKYNSDDKFLF